MTPDHSRFPNWPSQWECILVVQQYSSCFWLNLRDREDPLKLFVFKATLILFHHGFIDFYSAFIATQLQGFHEDGPFFRFSRLQGMVVKLKSLSRRENCHREVTLRWLWVFLGGATFMPNYDWWPGPRQGS